MISSSIVRLASPVRESLRTWCSLSRHEARWAMLAASTNAAWIPAHSHGLRAASEAKTAVGYSVPKTPWWRTTTTRAIPNGIQFW